MKPRAEQKIRALIAKGVSIPNPLSLDIGDEVDIDSISGDNVVLYPGTRLYGERTVISSGAVLGRESHRRGHDVSGRLVVSDVEVDATATRQ